MQKNRPATFRYTSCSC